MFPIADHNLPGRGLPWVTAGQGVSSLADPTGAGGVAYVAHIGGFAAGALVGLLLRARPDRGAGLSSAAFR
jgi:membrane associated rhomboid family serine protease